MKKNFFENEEIAEIRNDIKEIYKTADAKIERILNQIRNMTIAAVVGVGAVVAAVVSIMK